MISLLLIVFYKTKKILLSGGLIQWLLCSLVKHKFIH